MVICKFFQQGNCRFGQNCRFEHSFYNSKYSYHAPQTQQAPQQAPASNITDEQLLNQVQTEVQAVINGGQWIVSCYAPFKEKPNLPGLSDLSPDEARLFIYEAKASNNIDQAVTYINEIFADARRKHEQLLERNPNLVKILRTLYRGEVTPTPFSDQQNDASSVFRSAAQSASNVFGQPSNANPSSIFGQASKSMFETGTPENAAAKSIFAQANQNTFASQSATNVFGSTNNAAKSFFAQASQNVFQSQQHSPFVPTPEQVFNTHADPFGQKQASFQTPGNVFQKSVQVQPSNVFGSSQNVSSEVGVYSKMEDLTEDDLEAFKSDGFKLGFVPELPPPRDLCI